MEVAQKMTSEKAFVDRYSKKSCGRDIVPLWPDSPIFIYASENWRELQSFSNQKFTQPIQTTIQTTTNED